MIFSFSLLFSTANATSEALFRVFDKFKTITFVNSSESIFKLVLLLIVLFLGYGIRGVLFVYIFISFFGFILRQVLVNKLLREKGLNNWFLSKIKTLSHKLREIIWFLFNTSFTATLTIAGEIYLPVLILGHFFGSAPAGLYKVAGSVIKLNRRITGPLYEAIFPKLVSLSTSNLYERFVEIIKFSTKSLFKFMIPASIIVFLFAEKIIGFIFGSEYIPASDTMRVMAVAILFSSTIFWLTPALLSMEKSGLRTSIYLFKILIYVVLLLVLVPKYSHLGAGISYLIVESLNFIVAIYLGFRLSSEYVLNRKKRL